MLFEWLYNSNIFKNLLLVLVDEHIDKVKMDLDIFYWMNFIRKVQHSKS